MTDYRLYLQTYTGPWARPDSETIVCELPLRLRKLLLEECNGVLDGPWAYLHRVWVRAPLRRGGYGDCVLKKTLRTTDALGLSLMLRCAPFDAQGLKKTKLRAWYRQHGFVPVIAGRPDLLARAL